MNAFKRFGFFVLALACSVILMRCQKKTTASSVTSVTTKSFLYAPIQSGGQIRGFSVNSDSGALTELTASPFSSNASTIYGNCVDPLGEYLYTVDQTGKKIYAYSISTAGELTAVTGSPFTTTALSAYECIVSPDGNHLYVTNFSVSSPGIHAWSIDRATGALTAVSGSPYTTGSSPYGLTSTRSGGAVYVGSGATINGFTRNSSTGALTAISPSASTSSTVTSLIPNIADTLLYAVQLSSGKISYHTINATTYALGTQQGSNGTTENFYGSYVTPDGKYLYAANYVGSVAPFAINTDGSLTALTSITLSGAGPFSVAGTADGKNLYVVGLITKTIHAFSIASTGLLTEVTGSPYALGQSPYYIQIANVPQ